MQTTSLMTLNMLQEKARQKTSYYIMPFTRNVQKRQIEIERDWSSVAEARSLTANRDDETVGKAAQPSLRTSELHTSNE